MLPHQIEELVEIVSTMGRGNLIEQFRSYRASFPVDFTPEYLHAQDTDQLRHLFVAMCVQSKRMPDLPNAA